MRLSLIAALVVLIGPWGAMAQDLVPARRLVLTEGQDLPGSDIRSIFDTTLEACQRSCLADAACVAMTYNARAGSCFPKSRAEAPVPYAGAVSGKVIATAPEAMSRARANAADLPDALNSADRDAARDLARDVAVLFPGDGRASDDLMAEAAQVSAGAGARLAAMAVAQSDASDQWAELSRLLRRSAPDNDGGGRREMLNRALSAGINAALRAPTPPARASALIATAEALEDLGRGRDMIPVLRAAQAAQARDLTASALDDAIGKYGFRVTDHTMESDSARPRLCAQFSGTLATTGIDYTPFVRLPTPGLSVEPSENQLCVGGLDHGARYTFTFRAGLPAADGEALAHDVEIDAYVRDRTPVVRFPGRSYVLPRACALALPVVSVNTATLDLRLARVSDRNLIRAMQNDWFGQPIPEWQEDTFAEQIGEEVWRGSADVGMDLNRDVTTRLPLDAVGRLEAGVYALRAAVPGADPEQSAPATQWFVVSDLGLTTLAGTDGLHVFVRSLATAGAQGGVEVSLLSRSNRVLAQAVTDGQGHALFAPGLMAATGGAAPALVMAEAGDDLSFLSLTDPEFDLADRGVEGREPAPPIDVFLTTDRGVYRAGEVVNVTALARDGEVGAIPDLPLTARLMRPDGVEYGRTVAPDAGAGGHVWSLALGGEVPRGLWRLDVLADTGAPPLASRTFLVEDFLPERIDVSVDLSERLTLDDPATARIEALWLFGAPAADLAVEGEVTLRAAPGLAAFPGYSFGLADQPFVAQVASFPAGIRTDADGRASVPLILPEVADPGRPLEAVIATRVSEGSNRPVERRATRPVALAQPLIAIRALFEGSVGQGQEAAFEVVAIGPDLTLVALPVRWVLERVDIDYQWYQMYGQWTWEPVTTRTRIAQGTADLGAAPLRLAQPVDWGRYELRVERADGRPGGASVAFDAGGHAGADAGVTPDMLDVSLDKASYREGEVARLRIRPRAPGVALVNVVSNHLIAMQAVDLGAGETVVDLPVTRDWGTGAYVTVSALRPMDVAAGRNPARALGLVHAGVEPGARRLTARLEAPATSDPRAPLPVALHVEGAGEGPVFATIAAVDVGILNLTGFASPDPSGHYFGQRKLGIAIRDVYGRLIDGLNGAMGAVRSGGDAGAQARLQADPPTEALVAFFSGPIPVIDGVAQATFDIPAFNGTVRLMAVTWSATAVGQAETDVVVRDPVVVTASLPRFLAPGDDSRLLLDITHADGPAGRMGLDVTGPGVGAMPSGVDLAVGGTAHLGVPITAGPPGLGVIQVVLTTPNGRVLTRELSLPVRANDPTVARTSRFTLAAGQDLTLTSDIFAGLRAGTGSATLAVGPIARFDAAGMLRALDLYPYGCTEQLTSKALPLLYFDEMANLLSLPGDPGVRTRVQEAVGRVLVNQSATGSFGLWSPGSGDLWLDSYVTDFLLRARAQGFAVPDLALRMALDNLRSQLNYAPEFDEGGAPYAYAMMVLAREGAAVIDDLRYYADVRTEAFDTPMAAAQLGAALANMGDQTRADRLFARAARLVAQTPRQPRVWRADYGSPLRDAAATLALATESGSRAADSEALATRVANGPAAGNRSTQEAMWTLLATHALIDRPGAEGFTLNGAPVEGPFVRLLEDDAMGSLVLSNGSARPEDLTLTLFGVPEVAEPAGGRGYAITRTYYTLDGEPADLKGVASGTRLVTVIDVEPTENGEARLLIVDPLPAGLEIDNPNLVAAGDIKALDWLDTADPEHAEFREDRFVAQVDLRDDEPFQLAYMVRAISPGRYHHPAASVEDMYRPEFRAITATGEMSVAP